MPEATRYAVELDSDAWKSLEDAYAKEFKVRYDQTRRHWAYYEGNHDLPLKVQKDGYNDNVVVNHVEALADRLTAFLIGDGVHFDADGDETELDDEIALLWQQSRGAILQESIALSGAIEGHCAIRLAPQEKGLPKITRIKQNHFAAFWDALDMERVLWYRLQYVSGSVGKRIDYVRGQFIDDEADHDAPGWTEVVYELKKAYRGNLSLTGWGAEDMKWERKQPTFWPYDFPPIVDWQNLPSPNSYYGKSDIASAIKLNDALNFILSNMQRIIKHHADPKTIITGATLAEIIPTQVGGAFSIANKDASVFNLEMQSDLASSQNLAALIAAGLWQSGGMVDPQTMKDKIGTLTNFGLRVLFADAIKRTEKKRLLYAEAFEQIAQRGLVLAGQTAPETVVTIWPDVLPTDDVQEVATLGQEFDRKLISTETYRERRGYDHERESERLADDMGGGDIGASILGLMNSNQPFNKGMGAGNEAAPSNLESTKGLNGAQINAALDILAGLGNGSILPMVAVELLIALGIDAARAEKMVKASKGVKPVAPAAQVPAPSTPNAADILARLKRPGA